MDIHPAPVPKKYLEFRIGMQSWVSSLLVCCMRSFRQKVSIGPSWTLLAVEAVFVLPFVLATVTRRSVSPVRLRVGSVILLVIVTLTLAVGIGHLILTLKRDVNGIGLIYSGLLLYGCNVLMFALWYWEIDGGGPEQRRQSDHKAVDFLFPQQMGSNDGNWAPQFFDYLYVAFTGATAFSPTDTMTRSSRGGRAS